MRLLVLLWCTAACLWAGEVALRGDVREQFTGLPIPGATVRILGTEEKTLATGLNGEFSTSVSPGEYAVIASADGFDAYRRGGVIVAEGSKPPVIEMSLMGLGSMRGRIVDGQTKLPLGGARVQAYLLTYVKGRRQRWIARQESTTSDSGEFFIDRLPAGEYALEIEPLQKAEKREDGATTGYARFFWPGPIDVSSPLALRSGVEHDFGSIAVERTVLGVVSFRLTGACPPGSKYEVIVNDADVASRTPRGKLRADCDSRASLTMSPGRYDVVAQQERATFAGAESAAAGAMVFSVGGSDQDVHVPMFVPVLMTGMTELNEGAVPRDLTLRLRLRVSSLEERGLGRSPLPSMVGSPIWPDGHFSVRINPSPSGLVELELLGLPSPYFVKDVFYNGSRVGRVFDLSFYSPAQELRVVLSDRAASIKGTVKDADGKAVAGAFVLVTPWPMTLDANYPLKVLEARAKPNGAFAFPTLPPGEYRVVAMPYPIRERFEEPNRLSNAFGQSSTVSIKEGEAITREAVALSY